MTRRSWLLLAVLLLAPLTPARSAPSAGTLTWALHVPIDRLDPPASFSLATGMVVGRNLFDRLVEHDERLNIVPGLATSWSTSRDGRTWTFRLRRGVRFHDGTPFTADAVVFNVQRALDPQLRLPAGAFAWAGVRAARKVDDFTVELVTDEPLAPLLNNIADSGLGAIVSPRAVQAARDPREFVPVGTGPFKFVRWTPDGEIVMEANRDYWGGPPRLERVVVRISPVPATRVSQLEAGEADLITQVPLAEVGRLRGVRGIEVGIRPSTSWTYIALNNLKPPFTDVRVRRAFNYAVNKRLIVDRILFGVGEVADSPIGSAYRDHHSARVYEYEPATARRLFEEAGWRPGPDGFRQKDGARLAATLWVPVGRFAEGTAIAQAVASFLRGVGADVRVEEIEFATYLAEARRGPGESRIEMVMAGWGTADPDTGMRLVLHSSQWPPAGNNLAFYRNLELDALLERARTTLDPQARRALYQRAQTLVMNDAPWLFLHERREAVAWRSAVRGVRFIPSSAGLIDIRQVSVAR
ncbi:MAG: ABC transporter substrate-binding protein [Armatimonadota bacterium]|nr:ABC transporter substrate-binding protein [Armatimonadota bacterium]MDR7449846.1 ABC transporter substrate-binding protein [Armatimonadota bacterium]MDR7459126.1 ABC transporter substrate-binding protein [Armatimonadota bacterium]MDR7480400.1 ABC transporter substrate-binding protein [Armatimonadota bacterium]MDR7489410.1 ABC transporter substrate-binding protein [Armatimonadota bacterium]